MTYLRDYTHDIFINYSDGPDPLGGYDGQRTDLLRQWTRAFVGTLTSELDITMGTAAAAGTLSWEEHECRDK